jgi:ABC-type branched-subunit amino acid transport system ATPase component
MADRVLEIDRISKRFADVTALRELSLDVRAGEVLGFASRNGVGRNGVGKATTAPAGGMYANSPRRVDARVSVRDALRREPR